MHDRSNKIISTTTFYSTNLKKLPAKNKIILAQIITAISRIIGLNSIMKTPLPSLNQFLHIHSFYPLILSSLLACSFLVFRFFFSGTYNYSNLLWNLFLAWMPYIFSVLASSAYRINAKRWWLIILLGILLVDFFPQCTVHSDRFLLS